MARYGKWIEGIRGDDDIVRAATLTLTQRILGVIQAFRRAACHAQDDPEHVHQLRVQTRRAAAALRLYGELLRRQPKRWFRRTLRDLRRVAGEARDLDVLADNLRRETDPDAQAFLPDVLRRRQALQEPIRRMYRRLKEGKTLQRRLNKLLKFRRKRRAASQDVRLAQWAIPRLREFTEPFLQQADSNASDLIGLHQFRIRTKKLRYAMELLAPAFPGSLRDELYPTIVQLQELLGQIHDQAVARDRMFAWAAESASAQARAATKLIGRECARLCDQRNTYLNWWDPARRARVRDVLQRLLELDANLSEESGSSTASQDSPSWVTAGADEGS